MTEKQTMTDDGLKGGSEGKSRESDLAALVRQYEQETGDDEGGKGEAKLFKALKPVVDFASAEMGRRDQEATDKAIDDAYKYVADGDGLKDLSKPLIRGFLEAYGVEDPSFGEAFRNQQANPKAWKEALGKGRDWIQEQLKTVPKSNLRSDLEAAKAAVAGTSTDEAEEEKLDPGALFAMSDAEFDKTVMAEIAKASK